MEAYPLGSSVKMASVGERPGGRLLICPNGSSGFMWDVRPGYPNWGYTQNTVTANEKLARAALYWLTGKLSGMSILLFRPESALAWGDIGFIDFVERSDTTGRFPELGYGPWTHSVGLSGTVTVTGANPTGQNWTLHDWDGWDPTAYDVVILPGAYSLLYNSDAIDTFLTSYGGSIWSAVGSTTTHWERYGIIAGDGTQGGGGAPDYMRPAFTAEWLGGVDTFQYGIYTSQYVERTENAMGGECKTFPNNTGNDAVGMWRQFSW